MRFHLPTLPGQPLTHANSTCAFTQKIRGFVRICELNGWETVTYGDEGCDVVLDGWPDTPPPFTPGAWEPFNRRVINALDPEPDDILGLLGGGCCQRTIADAFTGFATVEYGIGYGGSFAPFRVFESRAWQHTVYGAEAGCATRANGRFFDTVIPGYIDPDDFDIKNVPGDYALYLGRLEWRKGVEVAAQAAEAAGLPLILAGEGPYRPDYGECVGAVGPDDRRELLAGAIALLAPTLYLEPFGNVVVEAMMSGVTPITTDWGAFTETNTLGYRCHTLGDFVEAIREAERIDPDLLREHAVSEYSLEAAAQRYDQYFRRLALLNGDGWHTLNPADPMATLEAM